MKAVNWGMFHVVEVMDLNINIYKMGFFMT